MRSNGNLRRTAEPQRAILSALLVDAAAWHYGLRLAQAAKLPAGTIYSTLAAMEVAGWLESRWDPAARDGGPGPRRRVYRMTGSGQQVAMASAEPMAAAGGERPGWLGRLERRGFESGKPQGATA
jgi:hypothetical protein